MTSIETFGEDDVTLGHVISNMVKISGLVMECPQREELNGRMDFQEQLHTLDGLDSADLYQDDFLLTWDKSVDEMRAVLAVADALRALRENNKSCLLYTSDAADE